MRVFLCLLLLTLGSAALADNWVPLLRRGNQGELERRGARAGASGLAAELTSKDRQQVLAALHAARGAEDSWALLGVLAQSANHPDRSIAILAAELGAELSHQIDSLTISEQEIPSQYLREWKQLWLALASQRNRWIDIRIYSLEVAATLHELVPKPGRVTIDWDDFFSDEDGEMRAAAIELAPQSQALETRALSLIKSDSQPRVALSAGQRLCGPLGGEATPRPSIDEDALTRLHALAANKALAIEARVDLAPCFVADTSSESRSALATLIQQSPPGLRRILVALGRSPGPPSSPKNSP